MNDARFAREQRGGENWQQRILRAAHLDGAGKRVAAVNENLIHTSRTGNVLHLSNRFLKKYRGIFFPPMPKEELRSGRFQSPGPAFRPGGAATARAQSTRAP